MTRIWYLAHPVGAPDAAGVQANLARAGRWLTWLRRVEPTAIISAPWLATLLVGSDDDSDPRQRARGLADNAAIAARYGSIVLCGGRISSGMADEIRAVLGVDGTVADLTAAGREPPQSGAWLPPIEAGCAAWRARQADPATEWRPE